MGIHPSSGSRTIRRRAREHGAYLLELIRQEEPCHSGAPLQSLTRVEELVQVDRQLYREDSDSGHVAVISQMVAGSLARPELAKGVLERIEPWVDFYDRAIRKSIPGAQRSLDGQSF